MTSLDQDMAEMIAAHYPPVTCEGCGTELPAEYADDIYPLCALCIEDALQAEARPQ